MITTTRRWTHTTNSCIGYAAVLPPVLGKTAPDVKNKAVLSFGWMRHRLHTPVGMGDLLTFESSASSLRW